MIPTFTVVSGECSEVGGSEGVASLKVGGQNLAEFDLVAGAQGVKLGLAAIEQVHIGVAGDAIDIATIATLPEGHVLPATWAVRWVLRPGRRRATADSL